MMKQSEVPIKRSGLTFTNKVAIITGGSKGIGEGCARVFVDAGAKVMICSRRGAEGEAVAARLTAAGLGECVSMPCDVSKPDEVRSLIDATVERFGRLDCLVNNAGFHPPVKRIADFTLDDVQQVWQANFVSQFVACQHAIPHLRKTRGTIVNMSSLVGEMGQEGATSYCATKGAINAFTKSLAIEEAMHGVRVNAVLPGNVLTDSRVQLTDAMSNGDEINRWIDSNQHCNRSAASEEIGSLCLFLASEASSFITGTLQLVTAGAELGYGSKHPMMFIED